MTENKNYPDVMPPKDEGITDMETAVQDFLKNGYLGQPEIDHHLRIVIGNAFRRGYEAGRQANGSNS